MSTFDSFCPASFHRIFWGPILFSLTILLLILTHKIDPASVLVLLKRMRMISNLYIVRKQAAGGVNIVNPANIAFCG